MSNENTIRLIFTENTSVFLTREDSDSGPARTWLSIINDAYDAIEVQMDDDDIDALQEALNDIRG